MALSPSGSDEWPQQKVRHVCESIALSDSVLFWFIYRMIHPPNDSLSECSTNSCEASGVLPCDTVGWCRKCTLIPKSKSKVWIWTCSSPRLVITKAFWFMRPPPVDDPRHHPNNVEAEKAMNWHLCTSFIAQRSLRMTAIVCETGTRSLL